jgi:hypothetical protein
MSVFKSTNLWSMALVILAGPLLAGEPPRPAPAPAEKKEEKKPPQEEIFVFEPGDRRDPFSFCKELPKIAVPQLTTTGDSGESIVKLDPALIAQKKMEAMTHYNLAEQSLLEMNAADSMIHCDKGLEVFKDVPMKDYKELQEVRDMLIRMRKAAERVKQRQDAERDFATMNIKLTGVVAREKNSQAIVNAKVVSKGDVVPSANEGVDVVVADILPQQVVFVFRGYKMMLTLSEIGH